MLKLKNENGELKIDNQKMKTDQSRNTGTENRAEKKTEQKTLLSSFQL